MKALALLFEVLHALVARKDVGGYQEVDATYGACHRDIYVDDLVQKRDRAVLGVVGEQRLAH